MREGFVSAWLRDVATGDLVEASIVREISAKQFGEIAETWEASKEQFRELLRKQGHDLPENDSWNWEDKASTTTDREHLFVGVVTDAMQGMMMLATVPQASRRPGHERERVLYIEYLEAAPWNLTEYAGKDARYRRIGMSLLAVAVEASIAAGCDGRLALHTLPGARRFYEKAGFERIAFDESENLEWMELSGVTMKKGATDGPA